MVSGIFDGALGFVPVPLPFVEVNEYNWKNHRVTRITFQPDGCKSNSCTITGTNTLTLPEGTNIYDGLLTVEYQEEKLSLLKILIAMLGQNNNQQTIATKISFAFKFRMKH